MDEPSQEKGGRRRRRRSGAPAVSAYNTNAHVCKYETGRVIGLSTGLCDRAATLLFIQLSLMIENRCTLIVRVIQFTRRRLSSFAIVPSESSLLCWIIVIIIVFMERVCVLTLISLLPLPTACQLFNQREESKSRSAKLNDEIVHLSIHVISINFF